MSPGAAGLLSIVPIAAISADQLVVATRSADAERASRLIDVAWAKEEDRSSYRVELKILARDRRHLAGRDLQCHFLKKKVSILSGQMTAMKDVTATLIMTIEVTSQSQFDRVLGRISFTPVFCY